MAYIYSPRGFAPSLGTWTLPPDAAPDAVFRFEFTIPAAVFETRVFVTPSKLNPLDEDELLTSPLVIQIGAGTLSLFDVGPTQHLFADDYTDSAQTVLEDGTLTGTVTCVLYVDASGATHLSWDDGTISGDAFSIPGLSSFDLLGRPLTVWGSLFGYSDSLTAVSAEVTTWSGFLETYGTSSYTNFEPLVSAGSDVRNFSANTFAPLACDARTYGRAVGEGVFEPLGTLSDSVENATGYAVFQPMLVSAGGYPSVTPSVCFNLFAEMTGGGRILSGERAESGDTQQFKPMTVLGFEGPYSQGVAELQVLTSYGCEFFHPEGEFTKGLGGYALRATGHPLTPNSAYLTTSASRVAAYSGGRLTRALSGYSLSVEGEFRVVMRARLRLSGYALSAHGYLGAVGVAQLAGPSYGVSSYGGGQFSGGLGDVWTGAYQVLGGGLTGAYGSAAFGLRSPYGFFAGATGHGLSHARLIGPSLRAVPSAYAQLELRGYGLRAQDLVSVELDGPTYVVNVRTGAVTRYEDWPIDRVLRVGNTSFGVSREGVFRLQDAAGEVTGKVTTFYTDFGNSRLKACSDLYVHGTLTGPLTSTLQSDEAGASYDYPAVPKSTGGVVRTARAKLGRGLRGYSFCVSVEGAEFKTIDSLEVLHNETPRHINK